MSNSKKKVYTKEDWKIAGVIFVIGMIIVMIASAKTDKNIATSTSSSDLRSGQTITLKSALPVCTTKENLERLDNIMREKNETSKTNMFNNGEVIVINSGNNIEIVDVGIFTSEIEYLGNRYFTHRDMLE
ncbi:hypothetical protein G9F71_013630 [Clostridium sp. FP2]|uniref:hypothetical protein n=1 Tax=Clostridium TaxID=1485 RepID=UPI0013E9137F|nr:MULTISPECIES: hypothetical protein [Clostridium]MBW9157811.1 hypothetical protein [Clostridium tagluense]MBZ9623887.1 hypothetical protein [Clostridium sp. FP2]WLC63786.1 hypothetical protein KTC93_12920 [Clostridium tagluense]